MKRGLLPYQPGSIALKFGDYLDRSALPTIPLTFGHEGPGDWRMLGNDHANNCMIAGFAHQSMLYALATGRQCPTFERSALVDYSNALVAAGGPPYDPTDPSTDRGLELGPTSDWWKTSGMVDDHGTLHKIDAYTVAESVDDCFIAAYLFGACGIGLMLPDSAEKQFAAGHPWGDVLSQPKEGHYVPLVGRNSRGQGVVITWGALQAATLSYLERYFMVGVAHLTREYMNASGVSPEAIKWEALQNDLKNL